MNSSRDIIIQNVFFLQRKAVGSLIVISLNNLEDTHNQTPGSRYHNENHKGNIFLLTTKLISEVIQIILLMGFPGVNNLTCGRHPSVLDLKPCL